MGESNGSWGELAEHDNGMAAAWDSYPRLPKTGENPVFDAFLVQKGISLRALLRQGARLSDPNVLAFAYPGGIKYRDMTSGARWSFVGSEWTALKVVRQGAEPSTIVIVAEGETDAAWLSDNYPVDVAVLPAGARYFSQAFADQLSSYERVLVGLDNDEAGEAGTEKIKALLPHAEYFGPPSDFKDWCDYGSSPPLIPEAPEHPNEELPFLMTIREILEMETPANASWFEHELLPIGGFLMIHGWTKCYKSFLALDMLAALAQGQPWMHFEATEEPCKVAIVQFEIKPHYYQDRLTTLMRDATDPDLLNENFLTVSGGRRPALRAGNTVEEDRLLRELTAAGVQVMLLDPIRKVTGSIDMNDESEVRKILGFFDRLNDEGISVVAVHHDNKTASRAGGGDPLGMTGSGAFSGDPDSIVSTALPRGETLNSTKCRNAFFTLRNGAAIDPRGYEMGPDDCLLYSMQGHKLVDEDDAPPPANEPSI